MYAITEESKNINNVKVKTFSRRVKHVNTELVVEAGATDFRGYGPRETSARTYLEIRCNRGDFLFHPVRNENGRVVGIEIAGCGDEALMALTDSLGFALEALTDH